MISIQPLSSNTSANLSSSKNNTNRRSHKRRRTNHSSSDYDQSDGGSLSPLIESPNYESETSESFSQLSNSQKRTYASAAKNQSKYYRPIPKRQRTDNKPRANPVTTLEFQKFIDNLQWNSLMAKLERTKQANKEFIEENPAEFLEISYTSGQLFQNSEQIHEALHVFKDWCNNGPRKAETHKVRPMMWYWTIHQGKIHINFRKRFQENLKFFVDGNAYMDLNAKEHALMWRFKRVRKSNETAKTYIMIKGVSPFMELKELKSQLIPAIYYAYHNLTTYWYFRNLMDYDANYVHSDIAAAVEMFESNPTIDLTQWSRFEELENTGEIIGTHRNFDPKLNRPVTMVEMQIKGLQPQIRHFFEHNDTRLIILVNGYNELVVEKNRGALEFDLFLRTIPQCAWCHKFGHTTKICAVRYHQYKNCIIKDTTIERDQNDDWDDLIKRYSHNYTLPKICWRCNSDQCMSPGQNCPNRAYCANCGGNHPVTKQKTCKAINNLASLFRRAMIIDWSKQNKLMTRDIITLTKQQRRANQELPLIQKNSYLSSNQMVCSELKESILNAMMNTINNFAKIAQTKSLRDGFYALDAKQMDQIVRAHQQLKELHDELHPKRQQTQLAQSQSDDDIAEEINDAPFGWSVNAPEHLLLHRAPTNTEYHIIEQSLHRKWSEIQAKYNTDDAAIPLTADIAVRVNIATRLITEKTLMQRSKPIQVENYVVVPPPEISHQIAYNILERTYNHVSIVNEEEKTEDVLNPTLTMQEIQHLSVTEQKRRIAVILYSMIKLLDPYNTQAIMNRLMLKPPTEMLALVYDTEKLRKAICSINIAARFANPTNVSAQSPSISVQLTRCPTCNMDVVEDDEHKCESLVIPTAVQNIEQHFNELTEQHQVSVSNDSTADSLSLSINHSIDNNAAQTEQITATSVTDKHRLILQSIYEKTRVLYPTKVASISATLAKLETDELEVLNNDEQALKNKIDGILTDDDIDMDDDNDENKVAIDSTANPKKCVHCHHLADANDLNCRKCQKYFGSDSSLCPKCKTWLIGSKCRTCSYTILATTCLNCGTAVPKDTHNCPNCLRPRLGDYWQCRRKKCQTWNQSHFTVCFCGVDKVVKKLKNMSMATCKSEILRLLRTNCSLYKNIQGFMKLSDVRTILIENAWKAPSIDAIEQNLKKWDLEIRVASHQSTVYIAANYGVSDIITNFIKVGSEMLEPDAKKFRFVAIEDNRNNLNCSTDTVYHLRSDLRWTHAYPLSSIAKINHWNNPLVIVDLAAIPNDAKLRIIDSSKSPIIITEKQSLPINCVAGVWQPCNAGFVLKSRNPKLSNKEEKLIQKALTKKQ
jgi:hypothetical protein